LQTSAPQLSGGNQQKVVLSKWLTTRARVFIFDEPMQGIDVGSKVEICRLIGELAEAGARIILISSELREILALADRVVVMRKGRIVANLARDQATQEIVLGAIFGESAACWNLTTGKNGRPMAGGESICVTDHEVELAEPHVRK